MTGAFTGTPKRSKSQTRISFARTDENCRIIPEFVNRSITSGLISQNLTRQIEYLNAFITEDVKLRKCQTSEIARKEPTR